MCSMRISYFTSYKTKCVQNAGFNYVLFECFQSHDNSSDKSETDKIFGDSEALNTDNNLDAVSYLIIFLSLNV